ncbi:predicted protein [Nematostella vectensis]|uniref:Uncharacterized protein n=1 Tax=Nematostella vectensis TaxID=45351 RepID=A7RTB6_NEMVE|nr:predicted protein [Nematostella vectensis]|eukprot:XP_001637504.1 predicted protein [Nematostella vectensis]
MSSEVIKADQHDTSKAERAAKTLKKRGEPTPVKGLTTRPASSVSIAQSVATPHSRKGMEPVMENTYQTTPTKKFPEGNIRNIMKEVLIENLADVNYDPNTCRQLTKTISETLKNRVKELSVQRYKIICLVHIGQLGKQAMRIGSRCLWDANFDTYTTYEFKNGSLFGVATVYGVYFE